MEKRTKVVNCRREGYEVYIGRPSIWGNPFKRGTRAENIAKYEAWVKTQPKILARLPELKGKTIGCWCKPEPCHGDVLVKLIEELE